MPKYGQKPTLDLVAGDDGFLKYYLRYSCCGTIVILDGREPLLCVSKKDIDNVRDVYACKNDEKLLRHAHDVVDRLHNLIVHTSPRTGFVAPELYPCPVCRPGVEYPFKYVKPEDVASYMVSAPVVVDGKLVGGEISLEERLYIGNI